jgi:hypothetical protein
MDSKILLAALVALVPIAVYVYAMKRVVHASWREVLTPFRRPQKQSELPLRAAE